jgi:hypothetical protein
MEIFCCVEERDEVPSAELQPSGGAHENSGAEAQGVHTDYVPVVEADYSRGGEADYSRGGEGDYTGQDESRGGDADYDVEGSGSYAQPQAGLAQA